MSLFIRTLKIRQLKQPNLIKLAQRYVTDLNLPAEVVTYVERLMNLIPPKVRSNVAHMYPPYEARVMAYIIFVLKLIFGLDGHKEKQMSQSARNINNRLSILPSSSNENQSISPLFVWDEWIQFIEMRKVIVAQYDATFCKQFGQNQNVEQMLADDLQKQQRFMAEYEVEMNNKSTEKKQQLHNNLHQVFSKYLRTHYNQQPHADESISFSLTFTPSHSYFKRILLHASNNDNKTAVHIPEYMRIDHTQRSLEHYLQPKALIDHFAKHNIQVIHQEISCTKNRVFAGVFRRPFSQKEMSREVKKTRFANADFDISEEMWFKNVVEDLATIDEMDFKTEFTSLTVRTLKRLERESDKRRRRELLKHKKNFETSLKKWQRNISLNKNRILTTQETAAEEEDKEEDIEVTNLNQTKENNEFISYHKKPKPKNKKSKSKIMKAEQLNEVSLLS